MAGAGAALVVFVLWILFAIVLPIWTYSDAQQNSPHSAVLWALVVFFGGLLGFLLYFLLGRDVRDGGRGGQGVEY
ncbi:PLDc N-terminal domain-containing protein [Haloarculaceae archaeon H-GB2-1]|nr:PLDc N-terminal domain-containing protein [Haloarculaceae archaeon H-GB1-1]MEA5408567.1 PLDc N-terminal domain-containing protein [Haloarculaceae archaeon H-GB2-1]